MSFQFVRGTRECCSQWEKPPKTLQKGVKETEHYFPSDFGIMPYLIAVGESSTLQRLQGGNEARSPRPTQLHLSLHRHGDGPDWGPTAPPSGWERQQQRFLEAGGLVGHPAHRHV